MTTNKEMERIVRSWLEPGLTTMTDDVLDPVLDQLPATPQRRPWWPARRIADMSAFAKFAMAAAAVVVVAVVGYNLLGAAGSGQVGSGPSPSAEPSSSLPPLAPTERRDRSTQGDIAGRPLSRTSRSRFRTGIPVEQTASSRRTRTPRPTSVSMATSQAPGPRSTASIRMRVRASPSRSATASTTSSLRLKSQGSTDVVVGDIAAGSVPGKRVEVSETPGLDRSQCTYGVDGPHQIWVDVSGNGYLAFGGDSRAVRSSTSSTSTGIALCSGAPSHRRPRRRTSKRLTPSFSPSNSRHTEPPGFLGTNEAGRSLRAGPPLCHHAVLEVRHSRGLDHAEQFELHVLADAVEEPRASTEEDRDDMELDLVHEPRGQVLVDDVGAPADEDVLVAGGFPRLRERRLDPVGDEACRSYPRASVARARGA